MSGNTEQRRISPVESAIRGLMAAGDTLADIVDNERPRSQPDHPYANGLRQWQRELQRVRELGIEPMGDITPGLAAAFDRVFDRAEEMVRDGR